MNLRTLNLGWLTPPRRLLATLTLVIAASINLVHAAASASLTHTIVAAGIVGASALTVVGCTPIISGVVITDGKKGITGVPSDEGGIEVDPKGMTREALPALVPGGEPAPADDTPAPKDGAGEKPGK